MPTLDFKGKQFVYAHHLTVPFCQLNVVVEKSAPTPGAAPKLEDNLIIHGDNLNALKALLPVYAGRIKCIYIDPPYNTGNEGWCYNDKVNSPLMREWLKKSGNPVDKEDLERHDKWLCMMWPRLQLLRELLADDGVIFVSIDDEEQANLKLMMDEIFGEENFISNIIWQKKYSASNDAKFFSDNHDFILCFTKNKTLWNRKLLSRTDKQNALYKYDSNDNKGLWRPDNLTVKTYSPEYDYEITNPNTGKKYLPTKGRCWATNQSVMELWIKEGRVFFGQNGDGAPQLKRYLSEVQDGVVPITIWLHEEVGHTDGSRKELKDIFADDKSPFQTPKPSTLIKRILEIATDKNSLILDSFAGSGTTAHAVLALNKADGGNRKFILIECEDYADTITAERVRRVIKGVPSAKEEALKSGLGGSFTYCTLGAEMGIAPLLKGEGLPSWEDMVRHVVFTATSTSLNEIVDGADFYVGETKDYRLHVLYQPDLAWLRSSQSALTMPVAQRISAALGNSGKKALVFATHKFMGQNALKDMGITYCQLPYQLHRILGE